MSTAFEVWKAWQRHEGAADGLGAVMALGIWEMQGTGTDGDHPCEDQRNGETVTDSGQHLPVESMGVAMSALRVSLHACARKT